MARADINVGQATFWLIYLLQVLPLTIAGNRRLGNKSARGEDKRTRLTRDAQKSEIKHMNQLSIFQREVLLWTVTSIETFEGI